MNNIEKAVRAQLRFNFGGSISVEQLFSMKITKTNKEDLINYEETLQNTVSSYGQTNRRKSTYKTLAQESDELRLAIISQLLDEIEVKESEQELKAEKNLRKQELLAIKAQKQSEENQKMSLEEIDAKLKELED